MIDRAAVQLALVADGGSDAALLKPLEWALLQLEPSIILSTSTFHPRRPPGRNLEEFVSEIFEDYAPDLLFVHRDAEAKPLSERKAEIPCGMRVVPVVPVRMTEAWLLIEPEAIRKAAGNPNGRMELELPKVRRLEQIPDPKKLLYEALVGASGFSGRRRQQFDRAAAARRVAESIQDYSKLRVLPAFQELERDLASAWARIRSVDPAG